jgi:hypothetical protein
MRRAARSLAGDWVPLTFFRVIIIEPRGELSFPIGLAFPASSEFFSLAVVMPPPR